MAVDYESFRRKPWEERVRLFNAIPDKEKAELVRTHIRRWLEAHRAELTPQQIEVVEEGIAFISAELYDPAKRKENARRVEVMESRASTLLSKDQMREAFTMHWDL